MSRILIFIAYCILGTATAGATIRDGTATTRGTSSQQRVVSTQSVNRSASSRQNVLRPARTATRTDAPTQTTARQSVIPGRISVTPRVGATSQRDTTPAIVARAASSDATTMSETRTGAEYEKCKSAYFTCMDQFCQLKSDTYRRCSCSDRVYSLDDTFDTLTQAGIELTTFTENLDVVGMTAAQASAMRNPSDGENALMSDASASKALLQAIMNSIRGTDASVSGKYSDLNSINISFDTTNAFGITDTGQIIATYNGKNLYSAVYPQCRDAVRGDCNDAALQRAITAYLMAVEQDCNTVQTAIESKQKQLKSAVREGSAMLDLARVENRQKHNSSDFTACLNDVENAILSEEVCGANYHKCLDNGEFIDITTGKPIAGVANFNDLEKLLKFDTGADVASQKLSKVVSNRQFIANFESRTKKFAAPALDKCVESADDVWAEYLDRALLDIYYAQRAKVSEIKQGCFDFISSCYANVDTGLTAAMKELLNGSDIVIQPDKIELTTRMCNDYIDSCNNMFADTDIIAEYVNNRKDTDKTTACRAVAKQCFDKFGGTGFQNFYYPYSGLFKTGEALDWVTLYDYSQDPDAKANKTYKSECAKQLAGIDSCKNNVEEIFGGLDKFYVEEQQSSDGIIFAKANISEIDETDKDKTSIKYGTESDETMIKHREPRPTGVATEIYYQIIDTLSTQCANIQGRFMELQFILPLGSYDTDNLCLAKFTGASKYNNLTDKYGIGDGENMCPRDYGINVDTKSWGACLCWENGARRSKWGKTPTCVAMLPTQQESKDASCNGKTTATADRDSTDNWCTRKPTAINQICPIGTTEGKNYKCMYNNTEIDNIPDGITK